MTSKRQNPKSTKTVKKMAMLAGSMAAVGTMQANSQAAIFGTSDNWGQGPLTASYDDDDGTQVAWDVDGDAFPDVYLVVDTSLDSEEEEQIAGSVSLSSTSLYGQQLKFATDGYGVGRFDHFASSETMFPTHAFGANEGQLIAMSLSSSNALPTIEKGSAVSGVNFEDGDNFIGFQLTGGSATGNNYGWAIVNLDLTNGTVTIKEWYYETEDDTPIHIGDTGGGGGGAPVVPEPSSLALLALGAGGLFTYRARQKKLSADRSAEVTA